MATRFEQVIQGHKAQELPGFSIYNGQPSQAFLRHSIYDDAQGFVRMGYDGNASHHFADRALQGNVAFEIQPFADIGPGKHSDEDF
jgi:hypothetical protein